MCCVPNNHNTIDKYLYQINRYYDDSIPDENTSKIIKRRSISTQIELNNSVTDNNENNLSQTETSRKTTFLSKNKYTPKIQNLSPKNGIFELISYNINQNKFQKFHLQLPVISSIKGLSEISILTDFYLCGISQNKNDEGSYLIKITTITNITSQLMINSQFTHVYPSLISDKNKQIICIGGKEQTQCELYNSKLEKWYILPELPEERYKCTLCIDPKEEFLYLFGGCNSKNMKIEENNILRLHLIKQLKWEKINLKKNNNNKLIKRISAAAFCYEENEDDIFIVGGEDQKGKLLNDVIHFSIKSLEFNNCGNILNNKCKFFNQCGLLNIDNVYVFIDSDNKIHEIDKHDTDHALFELISFTGNNN